MTETIHLLQHFSHSDCVEGIVEAYDSTNNVLNRHISERHGFKPHLLLVQIRGNKAIVFAKHLTLFDLYKHSICIPS